MLRAEDLTLRYPTGDGLALDGLTFAVERGEVLGVVGPVESGKTSLAMAIAGLAPDVTGGRLGGELVVAGEDPRRIDDGAAGMVFEDYSSQLTQVRVIDEVLVPLVARGFDREAAIERAETLLERVRLGGYGDRRTWELSGGEQQRVAIAAVLARDPEVLVFDTATDMLDPEGRDDVSNLIASLAGDTTMVVTVDDPQGLIGVADEVLVLESGEQVTVGPAESVLSDVALFERVGVRPPLCPWLADELGVDPDVDGDLPGPDGLVDTLSTREGRPEAATTPAERGDRVGSVGRVPAPDGGDGDRRPDGDPVVAIEDVTFSYGDEPAVDGVDLDVHAGEVHAVIGGNGAGKSTLAELVVGLRTPDAGSVVVDGEATAGRPAAAVGEDVGLAFQNPDQQISRRTVRKELRFPLEQRRYDRSGWLPFKKEERFDEDHIEARVAEVATLTGLDLDGLGDRDPRDLPQGDRRLIAVGAALAPDPAAVVLDEPTAGLAAAGYDRMRGMLDRLADRGKAVLLVEHDMNFVCDVADRVTLLDDGETVLQGPPRTVFSDEHWDELRERYLRPPRAARLAARLGVDALTRAELAAETRRRRRTTS